MAHEFDGERYGQASAHQREWGTTLIAELSLQGTEHVLDLGCGDGALTARIAALVPRGHVMGIDASQGMIAAAQPKACENLRFVRMDINNDYVVRRTLNETKQSDGRCFETFRRVNVSARKQVQGKPLKGSDE
jgi:trans-aconitate methyltransferase